MDRNLHKENLIKLYKEGFDDSPCFVNYFFEKIYNYDNTVCHCINGECVSALHLVPKKMSYLNKIINLPYIVAAATLKKDRGKGYMGIVILRAFNKLYKKGQCLTMLYPFKHSYYEKFGFKTVCNSYEYKINYQGKEQSYGPVNDTKRLLQIYNDFYKNFDIYIYRDENLMQVKVDGCICDSGEFFLAENKYVMFSRGKIAEAVTFDKQFLNGILKLNGLKVNLPAMLNKEQKPYTMARIINAEKLLEIIPYDCDDEEFSVKITDNYFEKNNITLCVKIKNGIAYVKKSSGFEFDLTIENLTLLIFGNYSDADNFPQKLKKIFPVRKSFLCDKF